MKCNTVYCAWTGSNPMSDRRRRCLDSLYANIQCNVALITPDNLAGYILPDHPLHECYDCLSYVHRADYLRCYLMHFLGGGYCDIKPIGTDNTFHEAFDIIDSTPNVDIVGVPEIPGGAAFDTYNMDPGRLSRLVSCGFYVVRGGSEFTDLWYTKVKCYMDVMSFMLRRHPAVNGIPGPEYPIPYTWLLGVPFHHTCDEVFRRRPGAISRALVSGWHNERYK